MTHPRWKLIVWLLGWPVWIATYIIAAMIDGIQEGHAVWLVGYRQLRRSAPH